MAILGGVPSISIVRIIVHDEEINWIVKALKTKELYIPVYNTKSEKIY